MSVEFDPVRLGPGRRGVQPAVVGAAVMTIAIGIAIAKPWEPAATSPGPAASDAAIATAAMSPTGTPAPTPDRTPSAPDWTAVTQVVTPREAWGITAVLVAQRESSGSPVTPVAPRYLERWTPTTDGDAGTDIAFLDREDRSIAALGVTAPDGVRARAVRVWRLRNDNQYALIDAARIDDLAAGGTPLLVRIPLAPDEAAWQWEAGHYRLDVLTEGGIHRISVFIPSPTGAG